MLIDPGLPTWGESGEKYKLWRRSHWESPKITTYRRFPLGVSMTRQLQRSLGNFEAISGQNPGENLRSKRTKSMPADRTNENERIHGFIHSNWPRRQQAYPHTGPIYMRDRIVLLEYASLVVKRIEGRSLNQASNRGHFATGLSGADRLQIAGCAHLNTDHYPGIISTVS